VASRVKKAEECRKIRESDLILKPLR